MPCQIVTTNFSCQVQSFLDKRRQPEDEDKKGRNAKESSNIKEWLYVVSVSVLVEGERCESKLFDSFCRSPRLILATDTWANSNGRQPPSDGGDCRHAHYASAKAALAKKAVLKPNGLGFRHHPLLSLPNDRDGHPRSCVCNKQVVLKHEPFYCYISNSRKAHLINIF